MFARSTTFHGRPDQIDSGTRFVINEVVPIFDKLAGCRGLSMLVDRATGQGIVTSSWVNEATMLASDGETRPVRERSREMFASSMQVDEWEIASMHRSHHGECCRVSWIQGDLDSIIDNFRMVALPRIEDCVGFCSASLLVNRSSGIACATTCWETHTDMEASRSTADDLREAIAREAQGEVLDVHEYDLAYAHLHVPEMV